MATIVGGAIVAGSGLTAWATWAVSATPAPGTVRTEQVPPVTGLTMATHGNDLTFAWNEAKFASGAAIGGYEVLVTAGSVQKVACPVTTHLSCTYPEGKKTGGSFVVRARAGSAWAG